ncbi:MAG: Carbamoyltransferase [Candidatus Gottesmanbacteria bacterium GW2011_GWB1_43_11]|uniref:Carbamoyltransferase n=1 Tax=Candidatus Gottesmanbacteria bacterium GW2011_GWB1_43_11 TaxID=1618446 RepID=A0A0G1CNQ6_9BACT|nr:MAG: Carbamoyltransferase [Candidatus Gottesmanbacteria bacterium GW2011_GWA2_42_16]KKS56140.1 MAG: Carbamoyltransferase [Candidatus Gottesmanbacteria bacterium GW2011_GWA1_42_26]KKS82461.1 MAG: Carbamoyltransferase [Candidatus Gottesmanbacteria bacterium GW2011_GWC1_43_10]KKS87184.1 MAG: Carbamoyltransferase [Candidatus Gottesmanbacteria bacterium GW2011_GWB1_43_11]OGG08495.1 MAG: hypothetical protein A2699_05380 [Candidatus Gottesmanbacteria bacterium RIFCSPHIGHO2_01_FULL_43_15]HCM37106.1
MWKKSKPIYVLGLNEALGAGAALLKNGKIVAKAREDHFTKIKNQSGFPKNAIHYCCRIAGIAIHELNLICLSYIDPYPHFTTAQSVELPDTTPKLLRKWRDLAPRWEYQFSWFNYVTDTGRRLYYAAFQPQNQEQQIRDIATSLKLDPKKIIRLDHHLCHAYTAYFSRPHLSSNPTLVLTCDGAGDGTSAAVYIVENGQFHCLSQTSHTHSLGLFYASITAFLGFIPHKEEARVMQLARATARHNFQKIIKLLQKLIWVEGLQFKSQIPSRHFDFYLREKLAGLNPDIVACAAQKILEDSLTTWVKNAVTQTKIHELALAGGVFLNTRANQKIAKLQSVKDMHIAPNPGDESNALGAAFYGYRKLKARSSAQGG